MEENKRKAQNQESSGIEVILFPQEDYQPLKDYEGWRVAVLRHCENTKLEKIDWMQRHLLTDEVFVLLDGHCTLLLAGNGEVPEQWKAVEMEPHRIYNIRKGYWHNHILDGQGEVLIVENRNTSDDNSPVYKMQEPEIRCLRACVEK